MSAADTTVLATRRVLRHSNPVPPAALAGAASSPAALALLADITSGRRGPVLTAPLAPGPALASDAALASDPAPDRGPSRRTGPTRRWVLAGGAVAGLTAAGVLLRLPGSGGTAVADVPAVLPYALPQGQPAAPALERIAAATEQLPATARGRFAYVRTSGWNLSTAVGGDRATSVLASTRAETWTAADGSGRALQVAGPAIVGAVGSQETLDAVLGGPDGRGAGADGEATVLEPAEHRALRDPSAFPWGDPQAWADTVNRHSGTGIPVPVDVVEGITTLFHEQPVDPADRARTWRLLAGLPGVVDRGPTPDRLGRPGRAFTLDDDGRAHGLPLQLVLVVDEATGQLLEADQVLTTDPGKLNVQVPAVSGITVLVTSAWVDDDAQRPAAAL